MIRVAHLSFSGAFGGREKVAFSLVRALTGHSQATLYLVLEERSGDERLTDLMEHLSHYAVNSRLSHTKAFFSFQTLRRLADDVKKDDIQVLHSHCHKSLAYAILIKCFFCPSIRTTITLHGLKIPLNIKFAIHHFMHFVGIIGSNGIIGCSREILSSLNEIPFLRDKAVVIRNNLSSAVDASLDRDMLRKQFMLCHDIPAHKTVWIGNASRLTAQKNIPLYLEAIRAILLESGRNDLLFILAGDGELKEQVLNQAALHGLEESFLFAGFLTGMDEFFCVLDLFVLTSDWEGTPMALLEAMSHGLPAVASDVGGVADVVVDGSTGLLFPKGDLDSCVAALGRLIGDAGLRGTMGKAGRKRIVEEFTEERWVAEHLEHYQALLAPKGVATK